MDCYIHTEYSDLLEHKIDQMREKSHLSPEETERVLDTYRKFSLENHYGTPPIPKTIVRSDRLLDRLKRWIGGDEDWSVKDMVAGEVGYTLPWMVLNGIPSSLAPLSDKHGTASVRIECTGNKTYRVTFEEPVYK